MNLTKADAAMLGRRRAQPVKGPGELLAVFVAGRLVNPLNGSHGHWTKHRKWAKDWRERTEAMVLLFFDGQYRVVDPTAALVPKRVTFRAIVPSRFDDDNLRACLKPCRDALTSMRIISDDRESAGHDFLYAQEATRKAGAVYGVEIRVRLAAGPARDTEAPWDASP